MPQHVLRIAATVVRAFAAEQVHVGCLSCLGRRASAPFARGFGSCSRTALPRLSCQHLFLNHPIPPLRHDRRHARPSTLLHASVSTRSSFQHSRIDVVRATW
jgi:hypothetical protein